MGKVLKKVLSVVLLSCLVLSIASCSGGVKSKTTDQFKKAILNAKVGAKDNDFLPMDGKVIDIGGTDDDAEKMTGLHYGYDVTVKNGSYVNSLEAVIWNADDNSNAEGLYSTQYKKYVESGVFDGKLSEDSADGYKYFTLNGNLNDDLINGYCYGGWYYSGNTYIYVYTIKDDDSYRGRVDKILKKLGFPTPQ